MEAGATHAEVGGRSVTLRAGQFWVFSSEVEHTTRTADEGSRGIYLQLRPAVLNQLAEELGTERWGKRHTAAHATPTKLQGALASLRGELHGAEPAPLLVESLGQFIAGFVLRQSGAREAPKVLTPKGCEARLARAVELMHALPAENHSLASLADAAGLSKFRFAHVFKAHYGISPHRYLLRLRAQLGAERLLEEDHSVSRIAYELGFSSGSRFAREFRRHFHISPSEYRGEPRGR